MPRPEQEGNQPPQNGIVRRYTRGMSNLAEMLRHPHTHRVSRGEMIEAVASGVGTAAVVVTVGGVAVEAGRGVVREDEANAAHDLTRIPGVGVRDAELLAATGQDVTFSYDSLFRPEAAAYGNAGAVKLVVTTGQPGYLRLASEEVNPARDRGWLVDVTDTIDGSTKTLHPVVGILPDELYNVYVATVDEDTTFDGFEPLPARRYEVSRDGNQPDGLSVRYVGMYELPVTEPLRAEPTP